MQNPLFQGFAQDPQNTPADDWMQRLLGTPMPDLGNIAPQGTQPMPEAPSRNSMEQAQRAMQQPQQAQPPQVDYDRLFKDVEGMVQEAPDPYSLLQAHEIAFLKQKSQKGKQKATSELFLKSGMDPDELALNATVQNAQQVAGAITSRVPLDDRQLQIFTGEWERHMQAMPRSPDEVRPSMPNLIQIGMAALAAALNPEFASDIAATPFLAAQQRAQQENAFQRQRYGDDMDAWKIENSMLRTQVEDERERMYKEAELEKDAQEFDLRLQERADLLKERQRQFDEKAQDTKVQKAWDAYNKNPSVTNADRLRSLDPDFAPSPEEQTADWKAHSYKQDKAQADIEKQVHDSWRKEWGQRADVFGEVSEADAAELEPIRKEWEAKYGVKLPNIPTGKSVRLRAIQRRAQEFDKTLTFKNKAHRKTLAIRQGMLDATKERVQVLKEQIRLAHERGWAGIEVSQYNAALRAYGLEIGKLREQRLWMNSKAGTGKGSEVDKQKEEIARKLAGMSAVRNDPKLYDKLDDAQKAQLDMDIANAQGQIEYIESLQQENATDPESDPELMLVPPSFGGIGQGSPPMPGYNTQRTQPSFPTQQGQPAPQGVTVGPKDNGGVDSSVASLIPNGKYVWGGESVEEGGFDCSGLVFAYLKNRGLGHIGRTTAEGYSKLGQPITDAAQLQPGDVLFYDWNKDGKMDHTGIYLGGGMMKHAPGKGKNIATVPLTGRLANVVAARRFVGSGPQTDPRNGVKIAGRPKTGGGMTGVMNLASLATKPKKKTQSKTNTALRKPQGWE
jgi:cell wall-associated NlpC family hydrolase